MEHDAAKFMRSGRRDTQVIFATREQEKTALAQEAIMVSFGKGARICICHASAPVGGAVGWFHWTQRTAETLGLREIDLPPSLSPDDMSGMLRAHALRKSCHG
jgi:hypothetical protein